MCINNPPNVCTYQVGYFPVVLGHILCLDTFCKKVVLTYKILLSPLADQVVRFK